MGKNPLEKYAERGLQALKDSTPVDSGKTADSWECTIRRDQTGATIVWSNTNVNDGVNIAIILQYGHATGTGGYVVGLDYINPAMQPIFQEMADNIWKEITNL